MGTASITAFITTTRALEFDYLRILRTTHST